MKNIFPTFTTLAGACLFVLLSCSCKEKGPNLTLVFKDNFNRKVLGSNWYVQGGDWRIKDGAAHSTLAQNRNLVLKGVKLPDNAVIELVMWSESKAVDIKFNAWGDGKIHEHGDGYSFILGGWHDRISVISRLNEHEPERAEDRSANWLPNKRYKCKVVRLGSDITWYLDEKKFLYRKDQNPLTASMGYNYFSFGNWRSSVFFDDLRIYRIDD
ncbi:MAG: hypothetical protein GXP49_08345 [Deltaproteobacteria bacterium]|nr:hypothetical protein [Deltaproteobacteria bacterium]